MKKMILLALVFMITAGFVFAAVQVPMPNVGWNSGRALNFTPEPMVGWNTGRAAIDSTGVETLVIARIFPPCQPMVGWHT